MILTRAIKDDTRQRAKKWIHADKGTSGYNVTNMNEASDHRTLPVTKLLTALAFSLHSFIPLILVIFCNASIFPLEFSQNFPILLHCTVMSRDIVDVKYQCEKN